MHPDVEAGKIAKETVLRMIAPFSVLLTLAPRRAFEPKNERARENPGPLCEAERIELASHAMARRASLRYN